MITTNEKLITVKDYATREKIQLDTAYKRLKRGSIKGKKIGNFQFIVE